MQLASYVAVVVLCVTLVAVALGYLVHRNADRHDSEGGR
jgi:hypothetical protein